MAERGVITPISPQQPQAAPTTLPQPPSQFPLGCVRVLSCFRWVGPLSLPRAPSRRAARKPLPYPGPQRNMTLYHVLALCPNRARRDGRVTTARCVRPLSNPHDSRGPSGRPWPSSRLSAPGQRALWLALWQSGRLQHIISQSCSHGAWAASNAGLWQEPGWVVAAVPGWHTRNQYLI